MDNTVRYIDDYKNNNNNNIDLNCRSSSAYSSFRSSYSCSYYRHGAGRSLPEQYAIEYQENVCPFITGQAIDLLQRLIKADNDPSMIIDAIHITGRACRPSFAYFEAVVFDWVNRGWLHW